MNKCDNCGKEALIDYCNEHINSDFTCYELSAERLIQLAKEREEMSK